MPLPMAGEPQHAATKAPVARAARHDHAIEVRCTHFRADRRVTARVFFARELLVHGIAIIRRAAHHVERLVLVEARFELIPGARFRGGGGHAVYTVLAVADRLSSAGFLDR